MTLKDFKSSLLQSKPPDYLNNLLLALWYDAKGDVSADPSRRRLAEADKAGGEAGWDKAHKIAQDINDSNGAWIHAYLHRKEGDESNASYWYSHAGRKFSNLSLEEEWDEIAEAMLKIQK